MSSKAKSPNFSELEKNTLIELIESRKNIIENKQNDGRNICKKNDEWNIVASEFNSRHGVNQRTVVQLKALWKNLKARTKTAVAKDRREKKKTGGGPPDTELDPISITISEMLPQQINSLANPYDDDASLHGDDELNDDANENATTMSLLLKPITSAASDSPTTEATLTTSPSSDPIIEEAGQSSSSKHKFQVGRQDFIKSRILEMAEIEHAKKMIIYKLKEDVLLLKKRKLEKELDVEPCEKSQCVARLPDQNNNSLWQPFLLKLIL